MLSYHERQNLGGPDVISCLNLTVDIFLQTFSHPLPRSTQPNR